MTSTERQRKYRDRRIQVGDSKLCIWISREVKDALDIVTEQLGITHKRLIQRFILQMRQVLVGHDK